MAKGVGAGLGIGLLLGRPINGAMAGWALNTEAGKKFQKWMRSLFEDEKTSNKTSSDLESIPTLSGAKNQSGYGKVIPLVLGKNQFTPYYCGSPYHTISGTDGEEQIYHALYMLGYNDLQVTDFKLGMIDLAYNRDYQSGGSTVTCPTVDDGFIVINGAWKKEEYGITLELRQGATDDGESSSYIDGTATDGETVLYPEKVFEEELNVELMHIQGETHVERELLGYYNTSENHNLQSDPDNWTSQLFPLTFVSIDDYVRRTAYPKGTYFYLEPNNYRPLYRVVSDTPSPEVFVSERFSAKYPRVIEVEFTLNGLVLYDSNGNPQSKSIGVKIEASYDNGQTFEPFGQIIGDDITYDSSTGVSTITRAKNKVMRFVARHNYQNEYSKIINCSNNVVELRIQRTTPKDDTNNCANDIFISAIRTWVFDYEKSVSKGSLVPQAPVEETRRNMTARLALQIKADEVNFKNQLNELNCLVHSKAKTWDGEDWSTETEPTNNPASLMLMVMQHASRGKYAYDSEKIDLEQLGEFYEWCNQPRVPSTDLTPKYQCNGVLVNTKKTREIIDAILATARAKLILNNKKYSVWIDKPRDTPVMVLNNQNVLSASNSKSFKDLPDGYKIKFVNEKSWQTDEMKVLRDGVSASTPNLSYESIELLFQTDAKQVYQNGRYLLACDKLRQEVWQRKVSVDGNLLDIGSLVELQDDTISVGIGDGAEIKSVTTVNGEILSVTTDGSFYVDDLTKRYGIKVTCADGVNVPKVMSWEVTIDEAGEQRIFNFTDPIDASGTFIPHAGDILSFGFYEIETTQALCFGKKDNGDGTFDLTLVPYQSGVYSADSGTIPEFVSNVCDIPQRGGGSYQIDDTIETIAQIDSKVEEAIAEIEGRGSQAYIYCDTTSAGLMVDSDNKTTQVQTIRTLCHVIMLNEEREFSFGQFDLPTGWSVETDYHTVIITVPANTKVTKGGFNIPISYREVLEDATLVDEEESEYADELGQIYHTYRLGDEIITYNLPFGYVGVKGGNYKGKFNLIGYDANDKPCSFINRQTGQTDIVLNFSQCVVGDYITWTGDVLSEQAETLPPNLVSGAVIRTSRLYKFCGTLAQCMWEEDTDQTHTQNAITDVMEVLTDELEQNKNNDAVNYLEKLVANDVFVDRICANEAFIQKLVATDAFIENLATKIITLQHGGQIKSYWADCVFTDIEKDSVAKKITINNTYGLWHQFSWGVRSHYKFCLSNVYTDTPESLTYSETLPTVEQLNSYKYLYAEYATIGDESEYETYELKNPFFKLDSDTGKIEARDMVADGGTFNNLNCQFLNIDNSFFRFNNLVVVEFNTSEKSMQDGLDWFFTQLCDTDIAENLKSYNGNKPYICNAFMKIYTSNIDFFGLATKATIVLTDERVSITFTQSIVTKRINQTGDTGIGEMHLQYNKDTGYYNYYMDNSFSRIDKSSESIISGCNIRFYL